MSAPAAVPFPVTAPYRVRADLHRLGDARAVPPSLDPGPATVFRADARWPSLLAARLDALERHPGDVRAVDEAAALERLHAAGLTLARRAAQEQPQRVRCDDEAVVLPLLGLRVASDGTLEGCEPAGEDAAEPALRHRARALLAARPPALRRLEALALALQEDVALLGPRAAEGRPAPGVAEVGAADEGGTGRVAWLQVTFPSGWDPGAMAGASFERLHAPVPGAGVLRRAAPALMQAMLTKGPFVRYVWGVAPDAEFARHPRRARPMPSDLPLEAAYLRVERQTTLALPEQSLALFATGIHVTSLPCALSTPERRAAFAAAVASLDVAARRYKGIPWDDEAVRRWCSDA